MYGIKGNAFWRSSAVIKQYLIYMIDTDISQEILLNNLAYWERIGENPPKMTRQVMLENTYTGAEVYEQIHLFEDMDINIRQGGYCLIVVGDAIVNGEPVAVGDKFISMMKNIGMACEKRWIRNLNVNKKSFNQRARIKKEHVLLFKK